MDTKSKNLNYHCTKFKKKRSFFLLYCHIQRTPYEIRSFQLLSQIAAAAQRFLAFLNISPKYQENTCSGVSFFIKLQDLSLELIKNKTLRRRFFPVNSLFEWSTTDEQSTIKKKIKNILCTTSSPRFTVHNSTSEDVFYTACLLYRAMYRVVYEKGN